MLGLPLPVPSAGPPVSSKKQIGHPESKTCVRMKKKGNNILTEVEMRTGCPMHIATVLPHQKQLGKGHSKRLSRKARHRLEIIDWYNQVSERKSRTG